MSVPWPLQFKAKFEFFTTLEFFGQGNCVCVCVSLLQQELLSFSHETIYLIRHQGQQSPARLYSSVALSPIQFERWMVGAGGRSQGPKTFGEPDVTLIWFLPEWLLDRLFVKTPTSFKQFDNGTRRLEDPPLKVHKEYVPHSDTPSFHLYCKNISVGPAPTKVETPLSKIGLKNNGTDGWTGWVPRRYSVKVYVHTTPCAAPHLSAGPSAGTNLLKLVHSKFWKFKNHKCGKVCKVY
jgi:hypothetical protein